MTDQPFIPLKVLTGHQHQSASLGTGAMTLSVPLSAGKIMFQALAQNIRYTLDGTNPTASSGFQLKAGDPPRVLDLSDKITLKFFRETSGAMLEYEWGE